MTPVLHQIARTVTDLDRSVSFYRDTLGLSLVATFEPPGLAFFDLGGTRLLLERGAEAEPGSATGYLRVDAIDARHAELERSGVAFDQPPHLIHIDTEGRFGAPGTQEWMAFFRDPDDHIWALVESRAPGAEAS